MAVGYLFPGQGSQYVGMGHEVYEGHPAARALFEKADALFGRSLSQLAFYGPEETLTQTEYQQPALFVASLANWMAIQEGPWPPADYVAGHSLGEFAALVAAGSISFADGLQLVRMRGQLMRQAGERAPGAMAAILALSLEEVQAVCAQAGEETGRLVTLANDNCPGQTVISGDEVALQRAVDLAQEAGARRIVRLPITIAAHSALMGSVAGAFADVVDSIPVRRPQVPVVGNVSAQVLDSEQAIRAEIKAQLTSPVAWTSTIRTLLARGTDTFVEVGPNDVLLGLVKRIDRGARRVAFDNGREKD